MDWHEYREQVAAVTAEEKQNTDRPLATPHSLAWGTLLDFLRTIGFVLILAFLIRHFFVQPFVVDGASMEPNFHNQEYILVDKLSYRLSNPKRGDVVVFHPPSQAQDNFIKRIIGLPGEQIEIRGNRIFINGVEIQEPYLTKQAPIVDEEQADYIVRLLGENEYYVLGDNREHSKDSREIGAISKDRIIGRAWLVLLPFEDLALVNRPAYPALVTSDRPQAVGEYIALFGTV